MSRRRFLGVETIAGEALREFRLNRPHRFHRLLFDRLVLHERSELHDRLEEELLTQMDKLAAYRASDQSFFRETHLLLHAKELVRSQQHMLDWYSNRYIRDKKA